MNKEELDKLLQRYEAGTASPDEVAFVESWYNDAAEKAESVPVVSNLEERKMQSWEALSVPVEQGVYKLWFKIAVAAAVATIVFGVWFFAYLDVASSPALRNEDWAKHDVAPGKNGATITLVSGEVIALSDTKKGVVIGDGSLTYDDGSEIASEASQPRNDETQKLTASTAKGQTYEFTLPDGTHVWLNADSKISFPSQFSGKERKILLEGEAYFAVVHNAKQPFRVESRGQVVEDIGTEFNINAYGDEVAMKTTLVEGSAKVMKQGESRILKPKQQASVTGGSIEVATVSTENITDWKDGDFSLDGVDFRTNMRKIARWYNVEVIYEDSAPKDIETGGWISRSKSLSGVLKFIESTKLVHFRIEGRKVYVSK